MIRPLANEIVSFIQDQSCASICCTDENGSPYCFSCYYAFNSEQGLLYFKSSKETQHGRYLIHNAILAGTILPDKLSKLLPKGIQLQGEVLHDQHPLTKDAHRLYYKKHPMALAMAGDIFTISLTSIKLSDSSKLFGQKTLWNRTD